MIPLVTLMRQPVCLRYVGQQANAVIKSAQDPNGPDALIRRPTRTRQRIGRIHPSFDISGSLIKMKANRSTSKRSRFQIIKIIMMTLMYFLFDFPIFFPLFQICMTSIVPPTSVEIVDNVAGTRMSSREGEELTIQCLVRNAKPAADIVWFKRGVEIKSGEWPPLRPTINSVVLSILLSLPPTVCVCVCV